MSVGSLEVLRVKESAVLLERARAYFEDSARKREVSLLKQKKTEAAYGLALLILFVSPCLYLILGAVLGALPDPKVFFLWTLAVVLPIGFYGLFQELSRNQHEVEDSESVGVEIARKCFFRALQDGEYDLVREAYFILLENKVGPWEAFRLLAEVKNHSPELFCELFDKSSQGFAQMR